MLNNELSLIEAVHRLRPESLNPGVGDDTDRLRLRIAQDAMWKTENGEWRHAVKRRRVELQADRAARKAFWEEWRTQQRRAWVARSASRGTTVADLPLLLQQWKAADIAPTVVSACDRRKYEWSCPLVREHVWTASAKDRAQKGSACPSCKKIGAISDVPPLAMQLADPRDEERALGSNEPVLWRHDTWAVDPESGHWVPWTHEFTATPKDRFVQQHACRVCAGYRIDGSTSLQRWHPAIAAEFTDDTIDTNLLSCTDARTDRRWRCPDGHTYRATINNRVYGTRCSWCTSTTSRAQAHLAAELGRVVGLLQPSESDPRLPEGVPDLGSARVDAPLDLPRRHPRRYSFEEVDILLDLPGGPVGIEYDGEAYHGTVFRSRRPEEQRKEDVLAHLNIPLVRVREEKLPPIVGEGVVSVASTRTTSVFAQAVAVLEAIEASFERQVPGLIDYRAGGKTIGTADAEAYLRAIRNTKKPRRRPAPKPRKPRRPKDTFPAGTRQGHLVIVSGPTHQSGRQGKVDAWVYDVRCDCGTERLLGHWYLRYQSQRTCGSCR